MSNMLSQSADQGQPTVQMSVSGLEQELTVYTAAMLAMAAPPIPDLHYLLVTCMIAIALAASDQADFDATEFLASLRKANTPPLIVANVEELLRMRGESAAFGAGSTHRQTLEEPLVLIERQSLDGSERVLTIHNVNPARRGYTVPKGTWNRLDCMCPIEPNSHLPLEPFEALWLIER